MSSLNGSITDPTPEQRALERAYADPLSLVSEEDRKLYRGELVAVLTGEGSDRGKVIAHAKTPELFRVAVESSGYHGQEWVMCEFGGT